MFKKLFTLLVALASAQLIFAQTIDVQHYKYEIVLSDASDTIKGKATIDIKFLQDADSFPLNLVTAKSSGKGMFVSAVKEGDKSVSYKAEKEVLQIQTTVKKGETKTFEIDYAGVPADGLVISKNKFGDRVFFADNWPNRAHQWIPCNDQPSDKATVEFLVTAPSQYSIVSNGIKVEETDFKNGTKLTHWKEIIPLPSKVMVIGAAQFAVKQFSDSTNCVPVTAWIYPQDKDKGFYDYAVAQDALKFFSNYVGPYAFQKLANIQSTTIFGGMENASAIFYAENAITGKRKSEATVAHEVAHQWFGNMASEKSFPHLWLSEGFATYMTTLYFENKFGRDTALKMLGEDRAQVIAFSKRMKQPVVDSVSDLMDLLNANSYQKGGWVLHMLRAELGTATFKRIIQTYYAQYKGSNADTKDFQKVAETVSGKNLNQFFNEWLYTPGLPKLDVKWRRSGNDILITVKQLQPQHFHFPFIIGLVTDAGMKKEKLSINKAEETFTLKGFSKSLQLVLDPDTQLLFEGVVTEVK